MEGKEGRKEDKKEGKEGGREEGREERGKQKKKKGQVSGALNEHSKVVHALMTLELDDLPFPASSPQMG